MTSVPDNVEVLPDGSTIPVVAIAGTVAVATAIAVNNFPTVQNVAGTVAISNLSLIGQSTVSNNVSVVNFPFIQSVAGTVGVILPPLPSGTNTIGSIGIVGTIPVSGSLSITNLAQTQAVAGTVVIANLPATQSIAGAVAINNIPLTQTISGLVSVANFPTVQPISGTVGVTLPALSAGSNSIGQVGIIGTVSVSGGLSITNLPQTQVVSGSIAIQNLAATQTVSGLISVANFPSVQPVTGTVGVILSSLVSGSATIGNVGIAGTANIQGNITTIPQTGTIGGYTAFSVGTIDSIVLPGAQSSVQSVRKYLDLSNPSMTTAIYINFGATATIGNAPVILSPGAPRGDVRTWEGAFVPSDDIHCVASAPTTIWIGVK